MLLGYLEGEGGGLSNSVLWFKPRSLLEGSAGFDTQGLRFRLCRFADYSGGRGVFINGGFCLGFAVSVGDQGDIASRV